MNFITTDIHFGFVREIAPVFKLRKGLVDWEFRFFHRKLKDSLLECRVKNRSDRVAEITLSTDWQGIEPTVYNVAKYTYHETDEVLFDRIFRKLEERGYTFEEVTDFVHELIVTNENTDFELWWQINGSYWEGKYGEVWDK